MYRESRCQGLPSPPPPPSTYSCAPVMWTCIPGLAVLGAVTAAEAEELLRRGGGGGERQWVRGVGGGERGRAGCGEGSGAALAGDEAPIPRRRQRAGDRA